LAKAIRRLEEFIGKKGSEPEDDHYTTTQEKKKQGMLIWEEALTGLYKPCKNQNKQTRSH
jgi:hypothetical protein